MHHDALLYIRKIFDESTKAVGCGMNAKKSEIITDLKLRHLKNDSYSSKYVWLGYSLEITNDALFFTEEKFNKRCGAAPRNL